jgi:cell wall assembly regulator SMI1
MPSAAPDIAETLDRLERVLPEHAPELWRSLRPPASTADLDQLRHAVDPHELPGDVLTLLRWADGQEHNGPWWPSVSAGRLLGAAQAAEYYTWLLSSNDLDAEEWLWNPLWLPIAHDGWAQAGVEMTPDRTGAVVDAGFGDPAFVVIAPSLTAMLDVTADMLEAGIPLKAPGEQPFAAWLEQRQAVIDRRMEWQAWPYDRILGYDVDAWPPHWRVAVGFPAEAEYPHPPAVPIRAVLAGEPDLRDPVTIEGHVAHRVPSSGYSGTHAIVTLDDGTGSIHVLVGIETPGQSWAGGIGRRIQADVATGPDASAQVEEILSAHERLHTDRDHCRPAVEIRMGVQHPPEGAAGSSDRLREDQCE